VAYWAAEEGFKPRDVVALMMDNCPEFLFIWLGLAKAGISTALINTVRVTP
jgi:acyl-CoA synthetase (AMP-forming)/AMP-acid ligase II